MHIANLLKIITSPRYGANGLLDAGLLRYNTVQKESMYESLEEYPMHEKGREREFLFE